MALNGQLFARAKQRVAFGLGGAGVPVLGGLLQVALDSYQAEL